MPIRYSEKFEIDTLAGPRLFWAAPLNFEVLEDKGADFDTFTKVGIVTMGDLPLVLDIVHAAVARNEPELTREELRKHLDVRNAGAAIEAVLKACGFEKGSTPGEAGSP